MPTIYAVNGKEPVAAWIPSLDTAGNGTTTLTDLVGSNNGTLTNMDAATDWVADTDSGGVRALDFDGINDYVTSGATPIMTGLVNITVAAWVYATIGSAKHIANRYFTTTSGNGWILFIDAAGKAHFDGRESGALYLSGVGATTLTSGVWTHIAGVKSGASWKVYVNGVEDGSTVAGNGTTAFGPNPLMLGAIPTFSLYSALNIDDIRIFNQALDATDVAYLYNSGNGRGVQPATGNPAGILQNNIQSMRLGL